jgi:Cof subfamily protein (haloacid dehalogenase superfamily)
MIKIIFVDIDGTLFDHASNTFPTSAVEALKTAKQQGVKVVLASGRSHALMEQIGATHLVPVDAYITVNGGIVYDPEFHIIHDTPIEPQQLRAMIRVAKVRNWSLHVVQQDRKFFITPPNEYCIRSCERLHIEITPEELKPYEPGAVYAAMVFAPPTEIEYLMTHFPDLYYHPFAEGSTDIHHIDTNKGNAVKAVLKHFGLSPDEAMALGDGMNDKEMLQAVKYGIAMGNAYDDLKEVAYDVTSAIHDDGVVNALRKYHVIP